MEISVGDVVKARAPAVGRLAAVGLTCAALGCGSGGPGAEDAPSSEGPPVERALTCPDEAVPPLPLRRLTRFEFANSVRDVFGMDVDVGELFPPDEVALGYDNQAGSVGVTDLHVDAYLRAAEAIAAWTVADPARLTRAGGCDPTEPGCRDTFVRALGRALFRRPLEPAEVNGLMGLWDSYPDGEGTELVIAALLQSPQFIYRLERAAAATDLASPWVLAARLAFLLWGSAPDAELLDAAESGALASAADVERAARRMLDDPRAQRGALHFYLQWLELAHFEDVEKDRRLLAAWNDALKSALLEETRRFVTEVAWQDDGRLQTLLLAPYSFVDAELAELYGVDAPSGDRFGRVEWTSGAHRTGLLTQGSLLSRHAKADQTSPIHRGKFIRERFFCTTPPPPPPDLVVSPPRLDPRKTTRERFAEHRADPGCRSCHELLDPLGYAFEHYDAVGAYRTSESGLPVDASGEIVGTDVDGAIDGVSDLAERLASSEQVRACVVSQWFRFAYGRAETEGDACTLDKLQHAFAASDGDLRELLVQLTQTNLFLRPAPAPEPAEEEGAP